MKYEISSNARQRMRERNISEQYVAKTISNPTQILIDAAGRMLFKKLIRKAGKKRLLLIAGERRNQILRIITIIETSKIKKYL